MPRIDFTLEPFIPHPMMRNGHIHTLLGTWFRHDNGVAYRRVRLDTPDDDFIDVDFADMDAAAHGVSHEHAVVQVSRNQVFVKDFNSRNGTYINEQELLPMHEYPLSDGDELVLGQLRVKVQFIY